MNPRTKKIRYLFIVVIVGFILVNITAGFTEDVPFPKISDSEKAHLQNLCQKYEDLPRYQKYDDLYCEFWGYPFNHYYAEPRIHGFHLTIDYFGHILLVPFLLNLLIFSLVVHVVLKYIKKYRFRLPVFGLISTVNIAFVDCMFCSTESYLAMFVVILIVTFIIGFIVDKLISRYSTQNKTEPIR